MADDNIKSNEESFLERELFTDFWNPTTFHDRVLLVEGKKFYVTSGLLSFASEFFRGLSNSDFKEKNEEEISLEDVDAEDFDNFLRTIYPLKYDVKLTNIAGIMKLSSRFLTPIVYQKCMEFLEDEDNFDNLSKHDLLLWSEGSGSKELKAYIGAILITEFEEDKIPDDMGLWRFILPKKFKIVAVQESFEEFAVRRILVSNVQLFEKAAPTSQIKEAFDQYTCEALQIHPNIRKGNAKILLDIASKYNLAGLLMGRNSQPLTVSVCINPIPVGSIPISNLEKKPR